tara:strand:- start:144 stop:428 length:285 start_codon:yes stop_codon:yes gene_type:complete
MLKIFIRIEGRLVEVLPFGIMKEIVGGKNHYRFKCNIKGEKKTVVAKSSELLFENEKELEDEELRNYRRSTYLMRGYMLETVRRDIRLGRYKNG